MSFSPQLYSRKWPRPPPRETWLSTCLPAMQTLTNLRTSTHLTTVSFTLCVWASARTLDGSESCSSFGSTSLIITHSPESSRVWGFGGGWFQDGSTHLWGAAEDERWRRVALQNSQRYYIKSHFVSFLIVIFVSTALSKVLVCHEAPRAHASGRRSPRQKVTLRFLHFYAPQTGTAEKHQPQVWVILSDFHHACVETVHTHWSWFMFLFAVGQEEGCPRIIQNKLMRTFTVETFNSGRYDVMEPLQGCHSCICCWVSLFNLVLSGSRIWCLHQCVPN